MIEKSIEFNTQSLKELLVIVLIEAKNIGKLMPLEARDGLNQLRNMLDVDMMPANPSLCATPEDVRLFGTCRAIRGRATAQQIDALCEAGRDSIKQDLEDIGDIFQKGIPAYFDENMPRWFLPTQHVMTEFYHLSRHH